MFFAWFYSVDAMSRKKGKSKARKRKKHEENGGSGTTPVKQQLRSAGQASEMETWLGRFCQLADDALVEDGETSHLVIPEEYRRSVGDILVFLGKHERGRNGEAAGTPESKIPRLVRML